MVKGAESVQEANWFLAVNSNDPKKSLLSTEGLAHLELEVSHSHHSGGNHPTYPSLTRASQADWREDEEISGCPQRSVKEQ